MVEGARRRAIGGLIETWPTPTDARKTRAARFLASHLSATSGTIVGSTVLTVTPVVLSSIAVTRPTRFHCATTNEHLRIVAAATLRGFPLPEMAESAGETGPYRIRI